MIYNMIMIIYLFISCYVAAERKNGQSYNVLCDFIVFDKIAIHGTVLYSEMRSHGLLRRMDS